MYEYNNHLFDALVLPSAFNKELFINSLLLEHGEKPCLYGNIDFMKSCISVWGEKWYHSFERVSVALTSDYNPIHNYDRHEEYSDTENRSTENTNRINTDSSTSTQSTSENENKVSAFNETTYQPDNSSIGTTNNSDTSSTETNGNGSENVDRTLQHNAHLYGNIGVTKSQEMISDELELRTNKNMYDIVCEVFANELLINIY